MSTASRRDLVVQVERVLGVSGGGWERRTLLLLRVQDGLDNPLLAWEDQAAIRVVEDAYEILFDDFIGRAPGRPVSLRLRGYRVSNPGPAKPGGLAYPRLEGVQQIATLNREDPEFTDVTTLAPPVPVADRSHRYLTVPVAYARPEYGTFRLYYETNRDFDPGEPTLMYPADAQVTTSFAGRADALKKSYDLDCNVVTYQYRGTFASTIPQIFRDGGTDWEMAWHAFNFDNAVEDIDRIRADLLGPDGKLDLYAGSGMAVLSLGYLAKHHKHVRRAFLMSFFSEAQASCEAAIQFFGRFLGENDLTDRFTMLLKRPGLDSAQLYYVLQRLLYSDQPKAVDLITRASDGDLSTFEAESAKTGSVRYFVRSNLLNWPHSVVFMFETNVPTARPGEHDINEPFLLAGEPIARLATAGRVPGKYLDIQGLEQISTEVFVISGKLDQVTPEAEQIRVFARLPNARLGVFQAYHCLEDQRDLRRALLQAFVAHGSRSREVDSVLRSPQWRDRVIEFR